MGVYIKGMKMPKNCTECRFSVDGWCYVLRPESEEERQRITTNYCPLIKIPSHGNLIDKLELCHALKNKWAADDCNAFDMLNAIYNLFARIVLDAPVVIPEDDER